MEVKPIADLAVHNWDMNTRVRILPHKEFALPSICVRDTNFRYGCFSLFYSLLLSQSNQIHGWEENEYSLKHISTNKN